MSRRTVKLFALALLLVMGAGLATEVLARQGCLLTYEDCADCAQTMLRRAMVRLDLRAIRRANFFLLDCVIELYHCAFLGGHDSLSCPV